MVAKALLSLLSAVAAVTLALRSQHSQRVAESKSMKEERREQRRLGKLQKARAESSPAPTQVAGNLQEQGHFPATYGKFDRWPEVPLEERLKIARMDVQQVVETYGVLERTAYNWIQNALRDQGVVGELARFQAEQDTDLPVNL
jgi:hypothetical protein